MLSTQEQAWAIAAAAVLGRDGRPVRISLNVSALQFRSPIALEDDIAAALAESGARVCLVDADLRRPMIAEVMGLVGDVGLTSVLIGHVPLEEATGVLKTVPLARYEEAAAFFG